MAHAQKPYFVFPRNGRVHLIRWGRQFSRMLAAEVCASAWVMLDRPRSEVAWEYWLPTPFVSFPFTSPPVRHRVPLGSERALRVFRSTKICWLLTVFSYSFLQRVSTPWGNNPLPSIRPLFFSSVGSSCHRNVQVLHPPCIFDLLWPFILTIQGTPSLRSQLSYRS